MITRLAIEDFKRYRGMHEAPFLNGLNLIQGLNEAGKTTIFHAISFVLFKKLPFNVPIEDLKADGKDWARASVDLIDAKTGVKYRLIREIRGTGRRCKAPFTLYEQREGEWIPILATSRGTPEKELREKVKDILGFDKRVFYNVVYAPQKEFVDLVRGGRKTKRDMDDIIGITITEATRASFKAVVENLTHELPDKNQLAKDKKEQLNDKRDFAKKFGKLTREIANLNKKIEKNNQELEDLNKTASQVSMFGKLVVKARRLGRKVEKLSTEIFQLKRQLAKQVKKHGHITDLTKRLEKLETAESEAQSALKKLESEIQQVEAERRVFARKEARVETVLSSRQRVSRRIRCPLCGQRVDPALIKDEIMRHSTELNQLRQRLSEIERKERELKIAQKDLGRKDREIGAEKSKLQTAFETIKSLDNEINRKQTMLDVQEKNLENLSKNISASKEVAIELLNTNYPSLARKLSIIPEDKVDALYETYNSISKKVHGNQKQLFERLEAMRRELEGRRADQVEVSNRHQRAIKKLEDIKREFDRARKIEQHLKLFKRIIEAYVDLQLRLRDEYVKYIASRTYLWYRKLVSYPQYVRVDFDPTDYMLLAQPVDSSKLRPVCMWSGGGHETIFALALRLALAEIFGHKDFLMLDEPTDATDPLNREAIIEALYEASQAFNQVLLVTHHEPVKELPVYAINVKYDEKERTSKIEVVQPA